MIALIVLGSIAAYFLLGGIIGFLAGRADLNSLIDTEVTALKKLRDYHDKSKSELRIAAREKLDDAYKNRGRYGTAPSLRGTATNWFWAGVFLWPFIVLLGIFVAIFTGGARVGDCVYSRMDPTRKDRAELEINKRQADELAKVRASQAAMAQHIAELEAELGLKIGE